MLRPRGHGPGRHDLHTQTPRLRALPLANILHRLGIAYLARRIDGAWLLERRPDKGLLGGMLGWPGSDWGEEAPQDTPPIRAEWKTLNAEARHTFTHFHLRLTIKTALVPLDRRPHRGEFIELPDFSPADLPTVMRKAFDLAQGQ